MSKVFSSDGSMYSTFGKSAKGTWSAEVHMSGANSDDGDYYPAFGVMKVSDFDTRDEAVRWARNYMERASED